jgi:trehalose-6-phosphatase
LELRPSGIDKSSSARAILRDFGVKFESSNASPPGSAEGQQRRSVRSKKTLERWSSVSSATEDAEIDFILAIGDGKTDEIVFQVLQESFGDLAICATVGKKQTVAGWYLEDVGQVISLLAMLT